MRGWHDPFALLEKEDPSGSEIASVLAQEGVDAVYSGALVVAEENDREVVCAVYDVDAKKLTGSVKGLRL
jgi:hypothetical protein